MDWRFDGGTDAESDSEPSLNWNGPWERIPSPRGGAVHEKIAGRLLLGSQFDAGYGLSHFSTNGVDWKPAEESAIAGKFEGLGEGAYIEIGGDSYLIVEIPNSGEPKRRVYRSGADRDNWERVQTLAGLSDPHAAQSVQGQVVATTSDRLHLRSQAGSWKDITPIVDVRGGFSLQVAGSLLIARSSSYSNPRVSSDLGETWSEASASEGLWIGPWSVASVGGTYYSLGAPHVHGANPSPAIVRSLLQSSDGTSWKPTMLKTTQGLEKHSLTEMDGKLYALDASSRLVRISPNTLETTILTDAERTLRGRYFLWRIDSTLIASVASAAEARRGSVLTWQPGDRRWSLANSAGVDPYGIKIHDGKLMANSTEYQVYDREAGRWRLADSPRPDIMKLSDDGRLAWNPRSGCIYLPDGDGWDPRLQWTESGIVESCVDEHSTVVITDVVAYRDGYAIGVRTPADGKSLVYWNPASGAIESLNPQGVPASQLPAVKELLNVEGELWIRTAPNDGAPELAGGIFRLQNGSWNGVETDAIDGEAPAYVVEETKIRQMDVYGDEVVARVSYATPDDGWSNSFVRFGPGGEGFRWLELPDDVPSTTLDTYSRTQHTRLGPTLVSEDQLWRFDMGANEWQTVGQTYPDKRFRPQQVAAAERAVYVETADGRIFVTRATREGATE